MASGGKRLGAGRPKGAVTRKTQEIAERALADGISPLEVMLTAMRNSYDQGDFAVAAAFAKDAAPFCHPRLSAVAHTGKEHPAIIVEEMSALERARRVAFLFSQAERELEGKPTTTGPGAGCQN